MSFIGTPRVLIAFSILLSLVAGGLAPVAVVAATPAVAERTEASASAEAKESGKNLDATAATEYGTTEGAEPASGAASSASRVDPTKARPLLKGGVTESLSPIATDGTTNVIPHGTPVHMVMVANLNSEWSKVGDEVVCMVSSDVKDGQKVLVPGQWFAKGKVTEVSGQRRLGRDGFISVKFDKLVSPDGKYVLPVDATLSTKDSTVKSVAKVVAKDSVMVTVGAVGGAIMSVEMTGIPVAVLTHGYSVAIGGGVGATVGLIAALKRKGKIATAIRGEALRMSLQQDITLPAFNADAIPSAVKTKKIDNLDIIVDRAKFLPSPFGDKKARLLQVKFKVANRTDREYSIGNFVVVSDYNITYHPHAFSLNSLSQRIKSVSSNTVNESTITFDVESPRRKYWLVLLDRGNKGELTRVPLN